MNLTALPKYPAPQHQHREGPGTWPPSLLEGRSRQVLRDLVLLAAIVTLFGTLHGATATLTQVPGPAQPRPPLDFGLVKLRYDDVTHGLSRARVHALLGPPTEPFTECPELQRLEAWIESEIESAQKKWGTAKPALPERPIADRWTDPTDHERWVLVLYRGWKMDSKFKHGWGW